jgi:hypothetical protein
MFAHGHPVRECRTASFKPSQFSRVHPSSSSSSSLLLHRRALEKSEGISAAARVERCLKSLIFSRTFKELVDAKQHNVQTIRTNKLKVKIRIRYFSNLATLAATARADRSRVSDQVNEVGRNADKFVVVAAFSQTGRQTTTRVISSMGKIYVF